MLRRNVNLSGYTTFKTAGMADYFMEVETLLELQGCLHIARKNDLPLNIIGKGSNLLLGDKSLPGVTIVNKLSGALYEDEIIRLEAGESLSKHAIRTTKKGLTGLEWAYGIPGSIGGAVAMNAGAHGGQISDVLTSVRVMNKEGDIYTYNKEELEFNYRSSIFKNNSELIVISADFRLNKESFKNEAYDLANKYWEQRKETQPISLPTCGSVFKNPPGMSAAKLIQDCYLKGFNFYGAEVSTKHSNFIINKGDASPMAIHALINFIKDTVKTKHGIELELEVVTKGEFKDDYKHGAIL